MKNNSAKKEPVKKVQEDVQQVARTESAPAPVRRHRRQIFRFALVFVILAFAGLTFLVKTIPSFAIDIEIIKAIQLITYTPFATLMTWISWIGFPPQSFIIALVLILLLYIAGLRWESVSAALAAITSTVITLLVKNLVERPRPSADVVTVISTLTDYSFPSGHVMFFLSFLGFIWFLVFTLLKPSVKRTLLLILIGFPILTVGISRIYLGEHWPSDVLGAYLLGTVTLAALIEFYHWGKKRYFTNQPVARENKRE
ncbi:MAG: phosphatase PAP2 family protein [Anaerolineae bacterium]